MVPDDVVERKAEAGAFLNAAEEVRHRHSMLGRERHQRHAGGIGLDTLRCRMRGVADWDMADLQRQAAAAEDAVSAEIGADPVLAADVQVGPPKAGGEDEVRFALTSEASFNDGLAFPFVNLAIALGLAATTGEPWALDWFTHGVLWEIGAGIAGGWLIGRAVGWLTFHMAADTKLAQTGDGLIAIAATFHLLWLNRVDRMLRLPGGFRDRADAETCASEP